MSSHKVLMPCSTCGESFDDPEIFIKHKINHFPETVNRIEETATPLSSKSKVQMELRSRKLRPLMSEVPPISTQKSVPQPSGGGMGATPPNFALHSTTIVL